MILRFWTIPSALQRVTKRGGAGQGDSGTGGDPTSYGSGPPSSTIDTWRGISHEPEIAGSTGGFIGLITGLAVIVILGIFIGFYLWNRHRRRLLQLRNSVIHGNVPSLSISRPSLDPYDMPLPKVDTSDQYHYGFAAGDGRGRFGFGRATYARQASFDDGSHLVEEEEQRDEREEEMTTVLKAKGKERVQPIGEDGAAMPLDQVGSLESHH